MLDITVVPGGQGDVPERSGVSDRVDRPAS